MSVRVFIASTCFDLIDARAEIANDLRNMGLDPVLSDDTLSEFNYLEAAQGRHSIATCLENLKSCQYAIFLFSQRYGRKLDIYGHPEISATHLEYRTAQDVNLPIMFFVRDRTLAEYHMWRQNIDFGDANRFCNSNEVFGLIKEHDKRIGRPADSTNWIAPFTSTVDLLKAVRKRLSKEALKEELAKLMRIGISVPMPILKLSGDIQTKAELQRIVTQHVFLRCKPESGLVGSYPEPAYSISLKVYPLGDLHSVSVAVEEPIVSKITHGPNHFTLLPFMSKDIGTAIHLTIPAQMLNEAGAKGLPFQITHTLVNGYEISEHFAIAVQLSNDGVHCKATVHYKGKELISMGKLYEREVEASVH